MGVKYWYGILSGRKLILINKIRDYEGNIGFVESDNAIVIEPNPDEGVYDILITGSYRFSNNIDRSKFFGLLMNCRKFISNSSATYYEAPFFLRPKQIIRVGDRNRNRSSIGPLEVGGSDRIVKIIKEWLE